jgi:hypothetical protein
MKREKKEITRSFRKCFKSAVAAAAIAGATLFFVSCADLERDYKSYGWQFRPAPDDPPSWENDMGRPTPGPDGDFPFN